MSTLDRLTLAQRKVVFVAGVVVLAAFVVASFATAGPAPDAVRSDVTTPSTERRPERAPAPAAPVMDGAPSSDGPALDPAALAEAKRVATAFVERYASYRYDEDPRAKAETLRRFVTPALLAELVSDSGAPAARQRMAEEREVATATVEAVQTQTMGAAAVELLAVVRQDVVRAGQRVQRRPSYEVALVPAAPSWAVASVSR